MHLTVHMLEAQEVPYNMHMLSMHMLTLLSASPLLVAHAAGVFMVELGCACPFN